MFGRVLGTTLAQVVRSIALILLPISFVALIAWATAGSTTGNTGVPLRAALWIWLGAHHVPFNLLLPPANTPALLSYLPIGAVIFPVLAIRNAMTRIIDRLDHDSSLISLARILFAVQYTIAAMLLSYFSATTAIKPAWYMAPIFVLPLVLITSATVGRRIMFGQAVLYGSRAIALLLGIASIVLGISIFTHLHTVKSLTVVLQPGIFGGLLLLLLNIVYIPNAVVAVLGYFSGTGFAVGADTLVAPWDFQLNAIPAFPLLGALPTEKFSIALFGILIVVLTGALIVNWTVALSTRILVQSLVFSTLILFVVAFAASGSLFSEAMSAVGVSVWKFPLSIAAELGLGAVLGLFLPRLGRRR